MKDVVLYLAIFGGSVVAGAVSTLLLHWKAKP